MAADQPEAVALEALDVAERARALTITDAASYTAAAELLLGIKSLLARISDTFRPHIKRAYDAHRALLASEQAAAAPLVAAERMLKTGLVGFETAQEQIRVAEERRLQELARVDAETRKIAEAAALELDAQTTGDLAGLAEAQRILAAPAVTPTVILPSFTPQVAGIAYRETWTAEVENLAALVAHCADHPPHLNLVQVNQPALNALARALKQALQIPGVRAVKSASVAARR